MTLLLGFVIACFVGMCRYRFYPGVGIVPEKDVRVEEFHIDDAYAASDSGRCSAYAIVSNDVFKNKRIRVAETAKSVERM